MDEDDEESCQLHSQLDDSPQLHSQLDDSPQLPAPLQSSLTVGLCVVAVIAAAQTCSSEMTSEGLASLDAPFFTMWVHTGFTVFVLPITLALPCHELEPKSLKDEFWGEQRATAVPEMVKLALKFYGLWVAANYCYAHGLNNASPGLVTSVFSSCSAFVAIFSRLWLGEEMTAGKVGAVVLAVAGVLTLGLAQESGQGANPTLGVLFALGSSVSAAVYKVAFKVYFPGALSMRRLSLFLATLGAVNLIIGSIPMIALAASGTEEAFWSSHISAAKWMVILGGCVFVLVFNTAIAIGIAITTPLFISIGTLLTIPATMAVDIIISHIEPAWEHWLGAGLLMASFFVMMMDGLGCFHKDPEQMAVTTTHVQYITPRSNSKLK